MAASQVNVLFRPNHHATEARQAAAEETPFPITEQSVWEDECQAQVPDAGQEWSMRPRPQKPPPSAGLATPGPPSMMPRGGEGDAALRTPSGTQASHR